MYSSFTIDIITAVLWSCYRGSLDRQSMILERRLSREHDRRPSGDGTRLHLEEVKLRRKSTETAAVKAIAVKYVCILKLLSLVFVVL